MGSGQSERFDDFLSSIRDTGAPDLKVALGRLASEIKERLSKGSPSSFDFVASALRALSKIKGTTHATVRMSCLFDGGVFLFANGFDGEALEAARQLNLLAGQIGDRQWLRKAHTLQGIASAHGGNAAEAVVQFSKALQLARDLDDIQAEVSLLVNLGNALNYAGLYREAIPCLLQAASLAPQSEATSSFQASALCNLAQSYLHLEDFANGFRAISASLQGSVEPVDALGYLGRTVREFTYVQLALELGKLSAARDHSRSCAKYATLSGGRRATFMAVVSEGLCEIHGGDVSKGLEMLEKALAISGDVRTPEHIEALVALTKAYDCAGRPDLALARMKELLASIRAARQEGILALVSLPINLGHSVQLANEGIDLEALKNREAQLRVQVAEREVIDSRIEMLERLAVTADLREEMSGEHGYRVGRLASLMAEELNWPREACHAIDLAARLHDIGKIAVPDRILLNSQELKDAERHFMSTHTIIGAELLAKSNIPQLRMAEDIARCHHEWWNGEGYPARLAGKRIPIHARIVALADVFDALTHGRPFAKPWPMDRALEEIRTRRESQFDPELTDLFLKLVQRLRGEHRDLDGYLGRAGRNSPFLQARNKIRLMLAEEREREKKAVVRGNETRH